MVYVILAVLLKISRNIKPTVRQSAVLFQHCDLNKPKKFILNAGFTWILYVSGCNIKAAKSKTWLTY